MLVETTQTSLAAESVDQTEGMDHNFSYHRRGKGSCEYFSEYQLGRSPRVHLEATCRRIYRFEVCDF